jgi:hypothetical protein
MNVVIKAVAVSICLFILLTPSWIFLSSMTSVVRAVSGQCGQGEWAVDSILGTYWFCVTETE